MSDAIVQRWHGFVQKIVDRHNEIMAEAAEGVAGLMEEEQTDIGPLTGALKAIELRLIELRQKLENTFSDKVSLQLSGSLFDQADALLRETDMNLEHEYNRFQYKAVGDFYRRMWPAVQKAAVEEVHCDKCGGPMEVGELIQPRTVTCEHCGAIVQIAPHALVATFYGGAPDHLAIEACLEKRIAIERYRHAVEYGSAADDRRKWEQMELEYWQSYLEVRSKLHPVGEAEAEQFVDSRMQMWRMSAL
jgi:hypothetical protein